MAGKTSFNSRVRLNEFNPTIGFDRGASKTKEILWYLTKMLFFLSAIPYPYSLKCRLLRFFGARIGHGVVIKPRVNIHFPWKLEIGDHAWIGEEALILNFEKVKLGNHVCLSQRVFLCGGNHDYRDPTMPYKNGPITLMDGCWIGACSFIGPHVTVGKDTVVIVGSVITSDLSENLVYGKNSPTMEKIRWK